MRGGPADMTEAEATDVRARAHDQKQRYDDPADARHAAAVELQRRGRDLHVYRCPFSSITGGEHFHIGHTPSLKRLEAIAAAIRWFGSHDAATTTSTERPPMLDRRGADHRPDPQASSTSPGSDAGHGGGDTA